jgi:hypothetical protein
VSHITRIASIVVALSAWAGLVLQFIDSLQLANNRPFTALWSMVEYFTITTNILVALAFTALALGYPVSPRIVGGILLSIVLVGVVYNFLLRDLPIGNAPTSALANTLVHRVTPILVTLFWIACAPKGQLQWSDAVRWAAYPSFYFGYALLRGKSDGTYAYPFINVAKIGWSATARNAVAIAVCFIVASLILIGIDHLGRRTT